MSKTRLAIAAVALVAAVFLALLASDLRSWRDGVRSGDALFDQNPASATWQTPTVLPLDPARRILGISDQIEHRRGGAVLRPRALARAGASTTAREASRARADLEVTLAEVARGPDRERNSAANNLLGILAYRTRSRPA